MQATGPTMSLAISSCQSASARPSFKKDRSTVQLSCQECAHCFSKSQPQESPQQLRCIQVICTCLSVLSHAGSVGEVFDAGDMSIAKAAVAMFSFSIIFDAIVFALLAWCIYKTVRSTPPAASLGKVAFALLGVGGLFIHYCI